MGYAILDQRGGDSLTATTLDGYSLLADTTVSSATTTVNFTGLNIGWGDELLLVISWVNPIADTNGKYLELFVNENTTRTNYYRQSLEINGTSVGGFRANQALFLTSNPTASNIYGNTKIKVTNNGYFATQTNCTLDLGLSSIKTEITYTTSTFTLTSITSLRVLTYDGSACIGTNSRFQLYKSGGGASRTWAIT